MSQTAPIDMMHTATIPASDIFFSVCPFPVLWLVQLEGVSEPVVLQVFVGNDGGRVKPHGFYQACRVTGRNTTACQEVDIDGTTVIEVALDPSTNMTLAYVHLRSYISWRVLLLLCAGNLKLGCFCFEFCALWRPSSKTLCCPCSVDCVGILKLRNADVEARIGVAGSKKKSTRARLVFRVNIPRPDGSMLTLQTPSSPILCSESFSSCFSPKEWSFFWNAYFVMITCEHFLLRVPWSLVNGIVTLQNFLQDNKSPVDLSPT